MITLIITICLSVVAIAAVTLLGYYFLNLVKAFVVNEQKKTILEIQKISQAETRKVVTPLQLQAYERLVLYLERMKYDNLILRCYEPGMSARLLKDVMIKNIRDEYEHNLSQQLYISTQAWAMIRNAKEESINILNAFTPKEDKDTTPTAFAGQILEHTGAGINQIEQAQEFLKKEMASRFE